MAPKFVCLILSLWCLEARVAPVAKLFPLEAYFPRGERSRNLLSHEPSGFRPQATSTYTSNSHEYQSQNKPLQSLQVNNSKSSSPGLGTLECTKAGHRWKSRVGTLTQLFTDTQLPRIGVAYTFWEGSMQRVSLHFSTAHARLYWNHSASRTWQLLKVMSQASTVWVEVICRHANIQRVSRSQAWAVGESTVSGVGGEQASREETQWRTRRSCRALEEKQLLPCVPSSHWPGHLNKAAVNE